MSFIVTMNDMNAACVDIVCNIVHGGNISDDCLSTVGPRCLMYGRYVTIAEIMAVTHAVLAIQT